MRICASRKFWEFPHSFTKAEPHNSFSVLVIFFLVSATLLLCVLFSNAGSCSHSLSLFDVVKNFSVFFFSVFCKMFFKYPFGLVTYLYLWASSSPQLNGLLFSGDTFILLWPFAFARVAMRGFISSTWPFRSLAYIFPGLSKSCFSEVLGFLLGFFPFQLYLSFF